MKITKVTEDAVATLLDDLLKRSPNNYTGYADKVQAIIDDVRERGDEALFEMTKRFDGADLNVDNIRVTQAEIDEAYTLVDASLIEVIRKYGFKDWDAVNAAVGHGGLKEGQVINKLLEEYQKKQRKEMTDKQLLTQMTEMKQKPSAAVQPHKKGSKSGIIVKGIDDVAVRFSKCCNPVPGDEIVGFVTRGRGVTIHRTDCVNMLHLSEIERQRLIDAEWQDSTADGQGGLYKAELNVYVHDGVGVLIQIAQVFSERDINVTAMSSRSGKNNTATINISFDIGGKYALNKIIDKLRSLDCVYDIARTTG